MQRPTLNGHSTRTTQRGRSDRLTPQTRIGDHAVIEAGKDLVRHLTVDESRAIDFMGPEIRVYATPAMIEDAEFAATSFSR